MIKFKKIIIKNNTSYKFNINPTTIITDYSNRNEIYIKFYRLISKDSNYKI